MAFAALGPLAAGLVLELAALLPGSHAYASFGRLGGAGSRCVLPADADPGILVVAVTDGEQRPLLLAIAGLACGGLSRLFSQRDSTAWCRSSGRLRRTRA